MRLEVVYLFCNFRVCVPVSVCQLYCVCTSRLSCSFCEMNHEISAMSVVVGNPVASLARLMLTVISKSGSIGASNTSTRTREGV